MPSPRGSCLIQFIIKIRHRTGLSHPSFRSIEIRGSYIQNGSGALKRIKNFEVRSRNYTVFEFTRIQSTTGVFSKFMKLLHFGLVVALLADIAFAEEQKANPRNIYDVRGSFVYAPL